MGTKQRLLPTSNCDITREQLAVKVEAFTQLVEDLAASLSLIDYLYWRKATEDLLEHGQCRLYKRYEEGEIVLWTKMY